MAYFPQNENGIEPSANSLPVVQSIESATGNITTQNLVPTGTATAGSSVSINVLGSATVTIGVQGTYTGALSIQATTDGVIWITLTYSAILNAINGGATNQIASAANGIFTIHTAAWSAVRVTALAAVTGTANIILKAVNSSSVVAITSPLPTGSNNLGSITNVTQLLNGQTAHSTASTGSPLRMGGRVVPTTIATQDVTLVAGDASDAGITPAQQLLIKQNAAAELDYNFIFSTPVTTVTPQTLVQASGTASIRNYITSLRVSSDALGSSGSVWLLDGAYTVSSIAITTGLATTSLAHDYKIGDAVVFTALASGTGVSTNTVYYVTSIGSTTTFNFSATRGGSNVVPSVAYTGTTVYRILDQIRLQITALEPTFLDYIEPLRSSPNMAVNFLIPTSLVSGNIYITTNGYRGF